MEEIKKSYDDCPYHCKGGKIFDMTLRKFIPCPHCSEKTKELASQGLAETVDGEILSLPGILGIKNKYLKPKFVYDSVIPEGERIFLDEESLKRQEDTLEEIYLGLTVGQLPERSYCIGLGNKGRIDGLAYPLLAKAHLAGLTVAKFISCAEYNRMCVNMDDEVESFYSKDLVLMLIPDGASKADIASAKGLMQTRALKGKPTIFITTWVIEACSILLGYYGDETMFLATGVFVEYKVGKHKGHSKYINQLTGVENDIFVEEDDSPQYTSGNPNRVSMSDLLK